jgi:NADPH:quinone reductase-like Zn-dependent oxidoreductase
MLVGLVRGGGRAVSAVGGAGEATAIGGVTVANIGGDPARLAPLAATISEGRLHVAVRKTYPLADAAEALTDFTNGHTLGKLVITMSGD